MKTVKIFSDGASRGNPGPAGIGVVIAEDKKEIEISRPIGRATNNIAEYMALIAGLEAAHRLKAEAVEIYSDSELLVKQIKGLYKVRDKKLLALWQRVNRLLGLFKAYTITHIPREENRKADSLARQALKEKQL
ncbi:MAG: ribonuclease HI family protein [Thermodesulfovibrionales bacterium]|nr:ribonuclease HI family protein [Thermodesulfovibrionales bacterium]